VAACGNTGGTGDTKGADGAPHGAGKAMSQVKTDPQAAKLVPADIRKRGYITMAADLHYPPTSFLASDNKTPVGFNVDFADLLGKELGLKVETKDVSFDSVIPGLAAGRYDFTATDMTPTSDRLKVLDMITYWSDGSSLMVTKGNPLHLSLADLSTCGHKIAVMSGTTQQETYLPEISKACQSAGKKAVDQVVLPNVQGALTQLASRRVDGVFYDTPSLAWAGKQQPQFQLLSPQYKKRGSDCTGSDTAKRVCTQDIVALGVKKGSPLAPALHAAVQALMSGPAYQAVLDKWGLGAGAISTSQLLK
jgi:polar amino acid transport system substrate-binding protein